MKEYLHTGCQRGSLNMWTVGLKHQKIPMCGDRRNVRIGGIGRMLMIELDIIDPKLDVNFQMKYQLIEPFRLFLIGLCFITDPLLLSRNLHNISNGVKINDGSLGKTCTQSEFILF